MWKNFNRKVVAFDIYCQFVSEMLTPFAILTAANDISREYYPPPPRNGTNNEMKSVREMEAPREISEAKQQGSHMM